MPAATAGSIPRSEPTRWVVRAAMRQEKCEPQQPQSNRRVGQGCSDTPESEWKMLFKIPYVLLLPSACFQSSLSQQDCHRAWKGLEAKGCQAQQNLALSPSTSEGASDLTRIWFRRERFGWRWLCLRCPPVLEMQGWPVKPDPRWNFMSKESQLQVSAEASAQSRHTEEMLPGKGEQVNALSHLQ